MLKNTYVADVVKDGKIIGSAMVRVWFWVGGWGAYDELLQWAKDKDADSTIFNLRRL